MKKVIIQSLRIYILAAIVYSLAIAANAMIEHYCPMCAFVVGLLCALCFVSPVITASAVAVFLFRLTPEPLFDWRRYIFYSLLYVAITFAIHYFFTRYLPIWNFSIAGAII